MADEKDELEEIKKLLEDTNKKLEETGRKIGEKAEEVRSRGENERPPPAPPEGRHEEMGNADIPDKYSITRRVAGIRKTGMGLPVTDFQRKGVRAYLHALKKGLTDRDLMRMANNPKAARDSKGVLGKRWELAQEAASEVGAELVDLFGYARFKDQYKKQKAKLAREQNVSPDEIKQLPPITYSKVSKYFRTPTAPIESREPEQPEQPPPEQPPAPGPAPQPPAPADWNIRFSGMFYESLPQGGQKPLPGAQMKLVRRRPFEGAGGFLGRMFFLPRHGAEIPIRDSNGVVDRTNDPTWNGVSGEDGKYEYKTWIDPEETKNRIVVNIVGFKQALLGVFGGFEETSEMWTIPNLVEGRGDIIGLHPVTGEPVYQEVVRNTPKNFTLQPTSRARKNVPLRERARGEFYQHFGWGGLILALALFGLLWVFYEELIGRILTFFGLEDFFFFNSPLLRFGIPLAIALFVYFVFRARGPWGVVKYVLPVVAAYFLIFFILDLHTIGDLINFDWYLARLDLLRFVGVPQDTIDNMRDGVRKSLSFLQFKGAQPTTPEAKKIGGFEAIQLKFGSRHNNFALPNMFARMDYVLPITITNPNKFDTKLVVKNFVLEEAFLVNGTGRIMCGGNDGQACVKHGADYKLTIIDDLPYCCADKSNCPVEVRKPVKKYMNNLGDISPEDEKLVSLDFKGKTLNNLDGDSKPDGEVTNCRFVLNRSNPLFSVRFKQPGRDIQGTQGTCDVNGDGKLDVIDENKLPNIGFPGSKIEQCKTAQCIEECSTTVLMHNQQYDLPRSTVFNYNPKATPAFSNTPGDNPPGNELDINETRYLQSTNECECKVKKYYNIQDDLCFTKDDKVSITANSNYEFSVQGKGELLLVKTDADKKLAPRAKITSSAGPLTVTTYFVSDVHVPGKIETSRMFIQISNDGDGTATINRMKINDAIFIGESQVTEKDLQNDGMVKIKQCLPNKRGVNVPKDGITLSCGVEIDNKIVQTKVTGAYLTIPAIVEIDYRYSQDHSTTLNVKKETIPDGVTDSDQIKELNKQFIGLPYYCPNKRVNDPDNSFDTDPLRIYAPECNGLLEKTCTELSSICRWNVDKCAKK